MLMPHTAPSAAALNLTPLADVLLVLTLYLLLTYAPARAEQPILEDVRPPTATATAPPQGLQLSISTAAIRLDNQPVAGLSGGLVRGEDLDAGRHIVPLQQALVRHRLQAWLATPAAPGGVPSQQITVEATGNLRYATIERVLSTLAAAGYVRVALGVNLRHPTHEVTP